MTDRQVLVVEDDAQLREALAETLVAGGFHVVVAGDGAEALERFAEGHTGLVLTDVRMPGLDGYSLLREIRRRDADCPVMVMTAYGTIQEAVVAMHDGARDFLVKPFDGAMLLEKVSQWILGEGTSETIFESHDPSMVAVAALARRVAGTDATVLIEGESGTGKEVLAREIHRHSRRADGPFLAVNCAAIPDNMLEAMLFGYEKGAFTGAYVATPGKFEQASGGTLLLDEISEMPLALQAKLLRVLQEREVERLGGRRTIVLDARVLATTNRDLAAHVREGKFREDLYFRLNVVPVTLPPLRARRADLVPLALHLAARHAQRLKRGTPRLTADAEERLLSHLWPGNVRELDNAIQRALILSSGEPLTAEDLGCVQGGEMYSGSGSHPADAGRVGDATRAGAALSGDLRRHEHDLILDALRSERGSRKRAAERLGISARTLRYKLQRMRESGREISL